MFYVGGDVLIEGDDALDAKFADEMRSWILRMLSLQMRWGHTAADHIDESFSLIGTRGLVSAA